MLKKILALVAMLYAAASFAAVDVNKATAADLDGLKGIGPAISTRIIDERKKGNFKDWPDFIERIKGVGEGNAAKFSAEGMTVNGQTFKGASPAPAATEAKKADAKPATTAAAPVTPAAKPDTKTAADDAKAKKAADKQAKADAKKAKADAAKAAKDTKAAPVTAPSSTTGAPAAAASAAKK